MTTRRIVSTEKTILDKDDMASPAAREEDKAGVDVPTWVIVQLLAFTFAMIAGPIGTYYLSLNRIFSGNSTYAGATAAMVANLVLVAYVVVAFQSDNSKDNPADKKETKKTL